MTTRYPLKEPRLSSRGEAIGRPRKEPPPDAMERIEQLAAEGKSVIGISKAFNVSPVTMRRWLDEDDMLRVAIDWGRDVERAKLHSMLVDAALAGDKISAMFILKSAHGYREGDQRDTANRVSINFTLPGALSVEQFKATVENEPAAKAKRLPKSRTSNSRRV